MTFDMFQEYIEEHILEGWKSDVELDVAMVTKNNGVQLRGLYIKSKEMNVSPAIYLDEYYSYYLKGESLEEIIRKNMNGRFHELRIIILSWKSLSM